MQNDTSAPIDASNDASNDEKTYVWVVEVDGPYGPFQSAIAVATTCGKAKEIVERRARDQYNRIVRDTLKHRENDAVYSVIRESRARTDPASPPPTREEVWPLPPDLPWIWEEYRNYDGEIISWSYSVESSQRKDNADSDVYFVARFELQ